MKKTIVLVMTMLMCLCCAASPAFAADPADDTRTGIASGPDTRNPVASSPVDGDDSIDGAVNGFLDSIPQVTTDDLVGRLEDKGNDVITILQTVGRYVCIGAFIICCLLTLIGVMGNHRLLWGGVIGLILSGVAYACIVCGRDIVNWIASWAAS